MRSSLGRAVAVMFTVVAAVGGAAPGGTAQAHPPVVASGPVAVGFGGAVATVDADATRVGLEVLRTAATRSTPLSPPRPRWV